MNANMDVTNQPSQHNDLLTDTVKARSFTVKATISVQS